MAGKIGLSKGFGFRFTNKEMSKHLEQEDMEKQHWTRHFFEQENEYDGYVKTVDDAEAVIKDLEINTTTKYSVWKTARKKFERYGEENNISTHEPSGWTIYQLKVSSFFSAIE